MSERYADMIAKLLRQAESTNHPEEAEAFTVKAQELMAKYAISEVLLARAQGRELPETIVRERIKYTGIFQVALMQIGYTVARANGCRGIQTKVDYERPTYISLAVIGFESDVARVIMLDASVQIQASIALRHWAERHTESWWSKMQLFKARREFLYGFAQGLGVKLHQARRVGTEDAVQEESTRSGIGTDEIRTSTELVLVTKKRRVDDWVDTTYGSSLRSVTHNYQSGGRAARDAGYTAGSTADTGQGGVGRGTKGELS